MAGVVSEIIVRARETHPELVHWDGFVRERAVRDCALDRFTVALLAIRATDWVPQVRGAALIRLERAPDSLLVEVLPLLEHLGGQRLRAPELDALVEARLSDGALRAAGTAAAWRRLARRGALEGIEDAARDRDVEVRAVAARSLPQLRDPRPIAQLLVEDRVGWIAALALDALVQLDGADAIRPHLLARSATLRRRARDWARARGIDPRADVLRRLDEDPGDRLALIALAELRHPDDRSRVTRALRDRRSRVRAAALSAAAQLDPAAAKAAALIALHEGSARETRTAVAVLRHAGLDASAQDRLRAAVLDPSRPWAARMRALRVLRRSRWLHLALVLRLRAQAAEPALEDELHAWLRRSAHLTRGPDPELRAEIEDRLAGIDEDRRRLLELILRTVV